ncbi:MAG: ABC transporter substrate-binding protein, partial [Phreatobacter sp.]
MSINRRDFGKALVAAGPVLTLPGRLIQPAGAADDKPVRGGTLRWAYFPEPSAIIAINTSSGTGQSIGTKVNEGLLTYDYQLNPKPALATAWSISPDGLRYRFELRRGVKWHDGRDFTSADVAFSIERLGQAHPRGRATFAHVTRVETPDPHTAEIVLARPVPYLITALSGSESPIVPKHVYETFKPADQPRLEQTIGTGPFILKEWQPGSHLLFERNPDYWDAPKPYLDRIILRSITDAAARGAGLETGEIDISANPVALADLDRLRANPRLVVDTTTYAYSGPQQQLFFNYNNSIFRDRRVRLAIAHAIDLKALVNTVYYGYAEISPSPISVALPKFYNPKIQARTFDPALAERLLDEAGLRKGANGIRFKLRLTYNPFLFPTFGDFIRQAIRRIGIDVELQRYDLATYLTTVYRDRGFDLVIESLSNTFDPTPGVQRAYWSKNIQIGIPFSNAAHYANPEVDRLLEAAGSEPDEAKRRDLFFRFQEVIHEEVASVDLVANAGIIVANKRVRNYAPTGEGLNN